MAKRGSKKYRCDECKEESFHHWIERNRAARMRCPGCGSTRLELASEKAKDEVADVQAVGVLGHRDMTRPLHQLDPKRAVT